MDVRQLRIFATVAAHGSITAAGNELHVTQPALSRQLAALERSVGAPLFERWSGGVRLTEPGRRFLPDVEAVLAAYDALVPLDTSPAARSDPAPPAQVDGQFLVVGIATSIGRGLLPQVAQRLEADTPVTFSVRQVGFGALATLLVARQLDAVLAWLPLGTTLPLRHATLLTEPRLLALPSSHRLTGYDVIPFHELLDEPFLALPESMGPARSYWLAEDLRGGRPVRVGAVVNGPDETVEALARGLGVALVSSGNAEIYRRPEFVTRPVVGVPPAGLAVVWRSDEHRPAVLEFVRACREAAASP